MKFYEVTGSVAGHQINVKYSAMEDALSYFRGVKKNAECNSLCLDEYADSDESSVIGYKRTIAEYDSKASFEFTQWIAEIIADAAEASGYNVLEATGYYTIFEDEDKEYAVSINKISGGLSKDFYSIYISPGEDDEEAVYEYTKTLDRNELIKKLFEINENLKEQAAA